MRKCDGFTLIELIVVIAILCVLAGIAVPMYSGYVHRAYDAQLITEMDAILTAAQAANANCGGVEFLSISSDGKKIAVCPTDETINVDKDFNKNFCDLYGCESEPTAIGTILLSESVLDFGGSTFENGAAWYAYADNGHGAGWCPLS